MSDFSNYKLDNFCVIFDQNGLQIDGPVEEVIGPLPLVDKAKAFGFNVLEINGNDYDELRNAFKTEPTISKEWFL